MKRQFVRDAQQSDVVRARGLKQLLPVVIFTCTVLAVALTLSQRQTPNISFTQVRVTLQFNETKTTTEKYTSKISEAVAAKVPHGCDF